jgi:carbamoyltransferase
MSKSNRSDRSGASRQVVLGINCSHDAAACIAVDSAVLCAVSEERLTRRKHAAGLPVRAIEYCLSVAREGRGATVPDLVVINQHPPADFERSVCQLLPGLDQRRVIVNPSHHFLHACYAMSFTDERPLVVLVVDGSGYSYAEHHARDSPFLGDAPERHDSWEALSAYYVDSNGEVSLLIKDWGQWASTYPLRFPSLGHMYSMAATHIFGSLLHAGKVMGLAPFGDASRLGNAPIVTLTADGIRVDTDWILDVPSIDFTPHLERHPIARDLAARVQSELERAMRHLSAVLHKKTQSHAICLTGGVALNSVVNGLLAREGPFAKVLVTPAAQDAGTAIGAAAYGCRRLGGTLRFEDGDEFLGRCYTDQDCRAALARHPELAAERVDIPTEQAADDLVAGRIVGWFEGRSEFGPRALGHRSILADPRNPLIKDALNGRVKFRESFRPFGAAVLREQMTAWFEDDIDSPHMLVVSKVREDRAATIPAVVHVDGTCRLQTVSPAYPGSLRRLIEAFSDRTGVPLVLNTSLNICGEPISETPDDALTCVSRSGLDALYCGGWRVTKRLTRQAIDQAADDVVVAPVGPFRLIVEYAEADTGVRPSQAWIEQSERRLTLSTDDVELLMTHFHDGSVPISRFDGSHAETRQRVESLCDRGVLFVRAREPHEIQGR